MKREEDFAKRREHLKSLSDDELYERFWSLTEEIVKPLVELAYNNTSLSIERSVLLRMGFSSIEASNIAKEGETWNLLGKGLGNVVLTYAKMKSIDYMEAGRELANGIGWPEVSKSFEGVSIC
ncbi:D-ornithine 4,5-aminomutase subunit alpha [Clostridium collagenovorans DSM 3089]|uniref:D-ornithine 4,5-aminomutase subunit alpha n=1 Tax=Clostridium collagenovorans DSM 3089 TaxID=1121306 RepID=A0A1M5TU96_9CLOT|nr:ornithine aminomutase subunit alpha [Clostridium collagenovorans]SHH54251.1 D-ornithine 4,5-aminomutase subunit alpha [Clostridium collagenovorans DSM 3089]